MFEVQPLSSLSLYSKRDESVVESMMPIVDQAYNTFDYQPVHLDNQELYVEDHLEGLYNGNGVLFDGDLKNTSFACYLKVISVIML